MTEEKLTGRKLQHKIKADKRAEALRANLKRRKEQAKDRIADSKNEKD